MNEATSFPILIWANQTRKYLQTKMGRNPSPFEIEEAMVEEETRTCSPFFWSVIYTPYTHPNTVINSKLLERFELIKYAVSHILSN